MLELNGKLNATYPPRRIASHHAERVGGADKENV